MWRGAVRRIHARPILLWELADISRGILWFGDAGASALRSGAGAFVKRTLPRPEPMHFSDTTRKNLDRTYKTTAGASRVTRSTLNSVHNVIAHLVSKKDAKATGAPAESTGQRLRQEAGSAYNTLMDVGGPALNKLKAKAGYGSTSGYTSTGAGAGAGTGAAYGAGGKPPLPTSERPPLPTSEKPPLPPRAGEEPPAYGSSSTAGAYATDRKDGSAAYGQSGYGQAGYGSQAAYVQTSQPGSGATTPSGKKRPLLNRSLLAVDSVLSSLEAATNQLISSGTSAASQMAGHRYGAEAGEAVAQVGGSARNAVLVYVDVRGMGRRAILKSTAKGYVKARLRSGEKVELQGPNAGSNAPGAQGQVAPGQPGQAGQAGQVGGQMGGQTIGGPSAGQGAGGQGLYGHGKQDIVVDVPQMKK